MLPVDTRIKSYGPAKRYVKGRPIDELIARAFEPKSWAKLKAEQAKLQAKKKKTLPPMPKTRRMSRRQHSGAADTLC